MKILFLTLADIDDRSFGGAIRSNDIRAALELNGEVDTLVIHGAADLRLDAAWDARRVKQATYNRFGWSVGSLRQRLRIRRWVADVLRERAYDVIVARYLGLAVFVPGNAWSRLILDADDIFKTAPSNPKPKVLARVKLSIRNFVAGRLLRRARHVWFVNPLDGERFGTQQRSWLGNAVRIPEPGRIKAKPIAGRILMVGYFMHPPNAEGLRWFARHILPALTQRFPEVELHAVGKCPANFQAEFAGPIRIRGFVGDLMSEYDLASLVVAPIVSGGGSQIKVIDALAHGRPLVASAFSFDAFANNLRRGEHLLVAATEQQWIEHCNRMLEDPGMAEAMSERGYATVRSAHGMEQMESEVRRTLARAAQAQHPSANWAG